MDSFRPRRRNRLMLPLTVVAIAAAGVGIWYYLQFRSTSQNGAQTPVAANLAEAPTPASSRPEPAASLPAEQRASTAPVHDAPPEAIAEPTPDVAAAPPTATAPTPATALPPATIAVATTPPSTTPAFDPGTVMAESQNLMNMGDFVGARSAINPAVVSGSLPADQMKLAMQLEEQINKTLIFSPRKLPGDDLSENYLIKPGDTLLKIAPQYSTTAKLIQRINNIADPRRIRAGQSIKIVKGPFHAVVTKSAFQMDLYLGAPGGTNAIYVCSLPVGLGTDDSTPAGTWLVEPGRKLMNPKYFPPRGGQAIEPDDPKNPLGEYWIGLKGTEGEALGKTSYGIHGTIEPDSIGTMASAGCIRMRNGDVALVYEMLVEGKSFVVVKP